ncbi:N-acetylneuraminate synthase family protein [Thalassospiraceae bacterium LMO-JJ14]|nr:N-acetylneuraminate synthase family protein [Thalassospiraceae bacterium LMO-JJ14]
MIIKDRRLNSQGFSWQSLYAKDEREQNGFLQGFQVHTPSSFYGDGVFIIAEVGNNHEGDFALAQEMVGLAAETGVDAVKFQTIVPERFVKRSDEPRFSTLKKFEFSYDQFSQLSKQAHAAGLKFMSTPFDLESAAFLGSICDAIKIASSDNTFYALIEEAAKTTLPLVISTGLANEAEIRIAVRTVDDIWDGKRLPIDLGLLHCVSNYPTDPVNANIAAISTIAKNFPRRTPGYSDHTIGIDAAKLAVGAGARIIEKHFTIANDHSDFRDHQLSADPRTMKRLVEEIRAAEAMLGDGQIEMADCEKDIAPQIRRSIVAARRLEGGHTVGRDDLNWTRPGTGMPPGREQDIIGRKLKSPMAEGDPFTPSNLI